jgi:RNA polymerase sigma factor (sigma-70 family)
MSISIPHTLHIDRLRAHDPLAWSRCVREFSPALLRYATRSGHSDPVEVVGAVLETLTQRIHTFEGDIADLRAFAFNVAHARIVDDRRRQQRREIMAWALEAAALTADDGSGDHSGASSLTPQVAQAIAELPPSLREVIELRYLRQMKIADVARTTGRSEGAVRVSISRGLQRLRERSGAQSPTSGR